MTEITSRAFAVDDDYMAVRQFLIDSYSGFDRLFNWGIDRWDVLRYSSNAGGELTGDRLWERYVRIWEDDGRIVGVIHPEDGGDLHIEIDAEYRHLESEMYGWGERHLAPSRGGDAAPATFAKIFDAHRRDVLQQRGWRAAGGAGFTRRRSLETPLPDGAVPDGYMVRSLDLTRDADAEGRAAVSRSAFGSKRTATLAKVLAHAPTYRPDLDLAAFAGDGALAAHTTVWLDEANRYIVFEPVGTHAEHRRCGLASAVMAEGMRRAVASGATTAYVGSGYESPANILYESLGFVDADLDELWQLPAAF